MKNCTNFLNPYSETTMYFTLINCNKKNYCIPLDVCNNGHFFVSFGNKTCIRKTECDINVFDETDPFIHDYDPIPSAEVITEIPKTFDERIDNNTNKIHIVKILTVFENYNRYNNSDSLLIEEYIKIFNQESERYGSREIYLIIFKKFDNFNITIYPLDIESFAYDNIMIPNNLGFINFEDYFPSYSDYEADTNEIILIILLESLSLNSSINELNYYFYGMNIKQIEKSKFLNISSLDLKSNENNLLRIIYPLKSYYNKNSSLNKRNSEYLVENIRTFYSRDPNIELYNIHDPFFNDICFQFTSELDTDMTLNDRRKEYYINKSLCEDNCFIEKLIINENSVKSVCLCKFKNIFSFNKNIGIRDDIPQISKSNSKSILCAEKTFKDEDISKNPIFWVFIIFIFFLILLFLTLIFYGKGILKGIFNLETSENSIKNTNIISENLERKESNNNNSYESDKKIKINSYDDNIDSIKDENKDSAIISISNKNKKIMKLNKMKNLLSKNSSIYDNNINNNKKDKIHIDSNSSNNGKFNPP